MTVFGVDKDGRRNAVFVDEQLEGDFEEVMLADGISAEKAIANVQTGIESQNSSSCNAWVWKKKVLFGKLHLKAKMAN